MLFPILSGVIFSAFFMQVITSATLIMSGENDYSLIAKVIVLFSFCFLVLFIILARVYVKKGKINDEEHEYRRKFDYDIYYHPMDKIN